jgi:hypothetical protein
VASSACCSSSLGLLAALAAASGVEAQSSHLTRLELAAPALMPDPVSALAVGGWTSAWLAPAAGDRVTGGLAGLEHSGFASMTTVFAAARLTAGPIWQLSFAQTAVTDLFDEQLLAQVPELGTLRAAATFLGLDAAVPLGGGAAVSLGGRYERDKFLGDAATAWLARASATGPTILGVQSAAALERVLAGGTSGKGIGRLRVGLARRGGPQRLEFTVGVGAVFGDVWAVESGQTRVASSLQVSLFQRVTLSGALGAERDPFGTAGWLGFASFGLGLRLGPVGADVRRGDVGASDAIPTAVSLVYQPQ